MALHSLFKPQEISNHTQNINTAVDKLLLNVTAMPPNSEFEAVGLLSRMAADSIFVSAFGIDFAIQESKNGGTMAQYGSRILHAVDTHLGPVANFRGPGAALILALEPLLTWLQSRGLVLGDRVAGLHARSMARCYVWGALQAMLHNTKNQGAATDGQKSSRRGHNRDKNEANNEANNGIKCPLARLTGKRAESFAAGVKDFAGIVPTSTEPSLVQALIAATDSSTKVPFSDGFIIAQSFNILLAGYETTSLVLACCLYELAQQPHLQHRIYEEVATLRAAQMQQTSEPTTYISFEDINKLPYTQATFMETLRMWPPASPLAPLSRVARKNSILGGYRIPKGATLMFNIKHAHYNPKYWPEPSKFRPERFLPGSPEAEKCSGGFFAFWGRPAEMHRAKFCNGGRNYLFGQIDGEV